MFDINTVLNISSDAEFERLALELFYYQAVNCKPYHDYIRSIGVEVDAVKEIRKIPFLPIELFKTHDVYCEATAPEIVFTSSSTGGGAASRHMVKNISDYEAVFMSIFEKTYGHPREYTFYALLPSYLEREGSSLVYMVEKLIDASNEAKNIATGGFYLYDHNVLMEDIATQKNKKILFGVTYALLDFAEKFSGTDLGDIIIMETGGMKGRREELSKQELHDILKKAFSVASLHSEYGMAELTSQAYSKGDGVFNAPRWLKVLPRDLNDPFDLSQCGRGGINIIDLANLHSCAFIETQDMGMVFPDGTFVIEGRTDYSDIRGCNLLIQ